MNLYKIERDKTVAGWDEFDSSVVAADTEREAQLTHPNGNDYAYGWTTPDDVKVTLIGVAVEGTVAGPIVSSFNAG